jgi:hypothetical protein
MNKQLILVDFRNCRYPFLYEVVSDEPITLDSVVKYFIDTGDFNEECDNIKFVVDVPRIKL